MEKGALIMQRTSWNLVETLLLFLTQDHHGAHAENANLCQLKRKINVARKSDVSHYLLHFKTLAQTGMCWSWLFEEGVTLGQRNQTTPQTAFERLLIASTFYGDIKSWVEGPKGVPILCCNGNKTHIPC
jgi:hypothetical protein